MRPPLAPRGNPASLAAGAVTLALLSVPSVGAAGVGTTEQDRDPVVRLARDPGAASVVRSAEVVLPDGASRLQTSTYSMVAATWRGSAPRVAVRTSPGTPWRRLPVLEDGPTDGSAEGAAGVRGTDLVWTGSATGIDVRVAGSGHRDLRLVLIEPGELATDDGTADPVARPRSEARAGTGREARPDAAPRPELRTRSDWGADPRWRNGRPRYVDRLKQVHVHHTATGNSYRRTDVPGLIRGMYRYHTQSLGWFDLGYNFLVDRFGRAWVGRSGGPDRLVRGAHTLGFNEDSVGIAVIGTLTSRKPWRPAVATLSRLAAWKLGKHGRDATGKVRVRSTGSDRYPQGRRVRLPVIDGHRDTNETACPGRKLYDRLPGIRRRTQHRIDAFD